MKQVIRYSRVLSFAALFTLCGMNGRAQVVVTATAGVTGPTSYITVAAAFADINAGLPQGSIVIAIQANTVEPGACVLNASGAGAASYTDVTLRPVADSVMISGTTPQGRGLIELNGADNVTIDGDNPNTSGSNRNLTLRNTASASTTYTSVVRIALSTLINSGDNNVVRNCHLLGSATGRNLSNTGNLTGSVFTTYGILVGSGASTVSATTAPTAVSSISWTVGSGVTAANFTASNNTIDACARGIAINGAATSVVNVLTITDNVIGSDSLGSLTTVYATGISIQGFGAGLIAGNTVRNIESYIGARCMGIDIGEFSTTAGPAVIENNKVGAVVNRHSGSYGAYGISLEGGIFHTVRNNFVFGINQNMFGGSVFDIVHGVYGIRISLGNNHTICNNTVHLYGSRLGNPGSQVLSAALGIGHSSLHTITVRNNIFSNTMTGGSTGVASVCMLLPSGGTSSMNLTLNNNFYYDGNIAGQSGIAHKGFTYSGANLYTSANFIQGSTSPSANLRSYTSTLSVAGTNDDQSWASSNAAPFISNTDLHIDTMSIGCGDVDARAAVIAAITTDIDSEARDASTPDIGADEFTPDVCTSADGGAIAPAAFSICAGQAVTISSAGATTAPGITYQWLVAATSGGPYAGVSGGSGDTTVSYTTGALTAGTYYYVLQATCGSGPAVDLSNEAVVTVSSPVVVLSGDSSFCAGDSTLLTASSGVTSQWYLDGQAISGATTNSYYATGPGIYNLVATDSNGCADSSSTGIPVTVNALPVVAVNASATTVCEGAAVTLTGSGASTYAWTGGIMDGVAFAAMTTGTYTVTGTDANGCVDTAFITVNVNALPIVTLSLPQDTVCQNAGNVTLGGEMPGGGTWSGPGVSGTTFDPVASGTGMIGITYTYTDSSGCSNAATDSIWVDVCSGDVELFITRAAVLYPNPNEGLFTIVLPETPVSPVHVELTDATGQLINAFTMTDAREEVDINRFGSGVYFVRITGAMGTAVYRVMKQ